MKKIQSTIGFIIAIIIISISIFMGTGFFVKRVNAADNNTNSNSRASTANPGIIVEGNDPDTYNYDICWEDEFQLFKGDVHGAELNPAYKDFQTYCAENGFPADINWYDMTVSRAESLEGKTYKYTKPTIGGGGIGYPLPGPDDVSYNAKSNIISTLIYDVREPRIQSIASTRASGHASTPYDGDETNNIYTFEYNSKLTPGEAYVVSDEPIGEYSDKKQEALWALDGTTSGSGNSLYQEAVDYEKFDDIVRQQNGLNPEDKTNLDSVKTKVDQKNKEYTVGPFTVEYTEGTYGDLTFGGISDMKVIGYNSKGNVVRDDIQVKSFIVNNSKQTPDYFDPDDTLKVDETSQVYPKSGEEFEIVFDDPNAGLANDDPNRIVSISLKVKFRYMMANGEENYFSSYRYYIYYTHKHTSRTCVTTTRLGTIDKQPMLCVDAIRTLYEQEIIIGGEGDTRIDITMNLGGYVWEDVLQGKESLADGKHTDADIPLKNVKVTLLDQDGEVVNIVMIADDSDKDIYHHINSTLTDEEGYYQFNGLDPMKKYYVQFEYDGQVYLPTEYSRPTYNTNEWDQSSKSTERTAERNDFDNRFKEIEASLKNYKSTDSLKTGQLIDGYNETFSKIELMGYVLGEDGKYSKQNPQLIDGYEYNENGLQTTQYTEGVISKNIRDFIQQNQRYPNDSELKQIYSSIANGNQETWRKIQFIEDCKIKAYTGNLTNGTQLDLYPYYDTFYINDIKDATGRGAELTYNESDYVIAGVTYKPIYSGQYFINLGLWRRQEFDTSLRKDVYKAALKINNKTVVYNYNKRVEEQEGANNANGQDNNTYWDINVRMSDYDSYYNTDYNREIYETDYLYDSEALNHPGSDLEVYITYKITIRNQSMTILSQIKEVVDYYDTDYIFKPNLSWAMYQSGSNRKTTVDSDDYYRMMNQSQDVIDNESTSALQFIDNSKEVEANEGNSKYGDEKNLGDQYDNLYIRGLEDKKLASGESAYIYLTFEVKKDSSGRVILDDDSSPKENLAEINGYSTYYRDGTKLPNNVSKGSNNIAGLLDRDSNPGNLVESDLRGEKYEKNFEDDTDRAPSLRVLLDSEAIRSANGTVWEDERTQTVGNEDNSADAIIGDGIRQDDEKTIEGVTVQLVEKCIDGSEYIWQEVATDANGRYNFESFIPGNYVIRFYYGDTEATALTRENQVVSYNGQDFKSTTYQVGINQSGNTDLAGRYNGYTNTQTQNESGTYGYDIYKADSNNTNYSDAKDIWSTNNREDLRIIGPVTSQRPVQGRQEVINYSAEGLTNHKAEVLGSPYQRPTYNGTEYTDEEMNSLYQELMNETYMTAETGVIVAEFEYDRQQTDGLNTTANNSNNSSKNYVGDNQYNSNYTLNNIDLGLTERPKAQLEIDKSIANIKVTLPNNTILFDITGAANNAIWQDHKEYNIDQNKEDAQGHKVGGNNYYEAGDPIGKYDEYYSDDNKHRYSYREEVDNIVSNTDKGLVQLTMDEELMHGATIQVTYKVKVTNVGEVDYIDGESKNFYYKADTTGAHISTTSANQVVDYVQNNLQFVAANETNSADGWTAKPDEELLNEGLVNSKYTENLAQFNTIIQTESFASALKPGDEITKTLILSQLITPENSDDDLTYSNMVEIVKTSNEAGRRMAFSVAGNQNPLLDNAQELDSSAAERIIILPPFGEVHIYYIVGLIAAVVLIGGIILIKRKVLNNKNSKIK